MRVGLGAHAKVFGSFVGASPLREASEEALFRREPVDVLEIFVLGGILPSDVSKNLAAQVRYILSHRQLPVNVHVFHHDVLRILVADAFGARVKLFAVLFGPPIFQIALGVELAALVVKTVRQFVTDGATGVAVVWRVVQLGIVQRSLQNARGKIDVVHLRIVVGVYGGRRDFPFAVVYGLTDLGDLPAVLKRGGLLHVCKKFVAYNFHRAVVPPPVGIADFVANAAELGESLLF